eukprot:TRINITY_DN96729_c0_g1_i1.p1 TRINITY_DN96729_c0_g1~~TRINITY_DN96729_c0_g1_i1.p1  ORF type:complete len:400 (+),score=108.43 TRINITY_DN96729_c0_g1_i1:66-1202(+)
MDATNTDGVSGSAASMKRSAPAMQGLGQALQQQREAVKQTKTFFLKKNGAAKEALKERLRQMKERSVELKKQGVMLVKDPEFQTVTLSTAGGALALGVAGGAFGAATGVFLGGSAGVVPSLLTFGLSMPAGALIGGVTGTLIGATAGTGSGGAAGYAVYRYRIELKDGFVHVKAKVQEAGSTAWKKLKSIICRLSDLLDFYVKLIQKQTKRAIELGKAKYEEASVLALARADRAAARAKARASEVATVATTTRAGVSATSAVAAGTAGSVTGGSLGMLAGAAVGVVPALFTFGLSIPVGAGIGLCTGAAVGGGAGVVGGGAAGFAGFTYRKEIKSSADYIQTKAITSAAQAQQRAKESALHVKKSVRSMVGASTGGTH